MEYKIKVNNSTKNLKEIRKFVHDTLKELPVDLNEVDLIVLAIDEICSNLMIHTNGLNENDFLVLYIRFKEDEQGLEFEIINKGESFNYSTYEEPTLAEIISQKRKGGMGMMLVRRIMDSIEFKTNNSENICKLFKQL